MIEIIQKHKELLIIPFLIVLLEILLIINGIVGIVKDNKKTSQTISMKETIIQAKKDENMDSKKEEPETILIILNDLDKEKENDSEEETEQQEDKQEENQNENIENNEEEHTDEEDNSSTQDIYNQDYYIKVNNLENVVTIYTKDEDNQYTIPVKAMICSTGSATPESGTFGIKERWRWLGLFGNVYGQYVTQITGNILFHSVPYLERGNPGSLEYWEYDKLRN